MRAVSDACARDCEGLPDVAGALGAKLPVYPTVNQAVRLGVSGLELTDREGVAGLWSFDGHVRSGDGPSHQHRGALP